MAPYIDLIFLKTLQKAEKLERLFEKLRCKIVYTLKVASSVQTKVPESPGKSRPTHAEKSHTLT